MTTLSTDFDLMRSVAAATDHRNEEIQVLLRGFISRMDALPPSVWGGPAAVRFKEIVQRWNTESTKLSHALAGIAETIRGNERELRAAAQSHTQRISGASAHL